MNLNSIIQALVIIAFIIFFGGEITAGNKSKTPQQQEVEELKKSKDLPRVIPDESVGGQWMVDRFVGNSTAGSHFYQGPALEIGGLQRPDQFVITGDGTAYMTFGLKTTDKKQLAKVTTDGQLTLMMEEFGAVEGPMELCQAGVPIWNPKEKALYLTGPNCLRRLVEKSDGSRWIEVVAGIPYKPGNRNGSADKATFQSQYRGVVCNSQGVFFWLEDNGLRRIENGTVSSVPLTINGKKIKHFSLAMATGLLSLGENDDTLYISEFYIPRRIFRCDLRTGQLTKIIGHDEEKKKRRRKRKGRGGKEADGPALTHFLSNSGVKGYYDSFYNAIWVFGPDSNRLRWYRLDGDGWVRSVIGYQNPKGKSGSFGLKELNTAGVPSDQFLYRYCRIAGIDAKGGIYLKMGREESGIWRIYQK